MSHPELVPKGISKLKSCIYIADLSAVVVYDGDIALFTPTSLWTSTGVSILTPIGLHNTNDSRFVL